MLGAGDLPPQVSRRPVPVAYVSHNLHVVHRLVRRQRHEPGQLLRGSEAAEL